MLKNHLDYINTVKAYHNVDYLFIEGIYIPSLGRHRLSVYKMLEPDLLFICYIYIDDLSLEREFSTVI